MTTDYVSNEDFRRIFPYLTYDNYLAVRVSLETGLRIGDVVSLRPEHLRGNVISFTASKTGKAGTAKISIELAEKLRRYSGQKFIFEGNSKSGHRTRQAVWKNVKQAAQLAGIGVNVAPHSARKTFAVNIAKRDGFAAAKRALQHDDSATTVGYVYSGLITEATQKAVTSLTEDELDMLADKIADRVITAIKKELSGC